ncbi:MAG: preprotein translocase subunit SecA, partial [Mycobacterium sp.]|nr:preprotein translocase subunit SecA [Mycobacterium sp.]
YAGTPRNAACPCGSGKKYKRCHGDPQSEFYKN